MPAVIYFGESPKKMSLATCTFSSRKFQQRTLPLHGAQLPQRLPEKQPSARVPPVQHSDPRQPRGATRRRGRRAHGRRLPVGSREAEAEGVHQPVLEEGLQGEGSRAGHVRGLRPKLLFQAPAPGRPRLREVLRLEPAVSSDVDEGRCAWVRCGFFFSELRMIRNRIPTRDQTQLSQLVQGTMVSLFVKYVWHRRRTKRSSKRAAFRSRAHFTFCARVLSTSLKTSSIQELVFPFSVFPCIHRPIFVRRVFAAVISLILPCAFIVSTYRYLTQVFYVFVRLPLQSFLFHVVVRFSIPFAFNAQVFYGSVRFLIYVPRQHRVPQQPTYSLRRFYHFD